MIITLIMSRNHRPEAGHRLYWPGIISGYTEGAVGLGLDLTGLYAIKLDGGAGTSNDGNLPFSAHTGQPVNNYGRGGLTAKLRYSNSTLKAGLLEPRLPVIFQDDVRVLPQTFQGVMLEAREWDMFSITAGQLWNTSTRAVSGRRSFYLAGHDPSEDSNKFLFGGVDTQWLPDISVSYWFGRLENIYKQHYLGGNFRYPLGENTALLGTLSYFHSSQSGRALSGDIDNQAYGVKLGVRHNGHTLSTHYQRMQGKDPFPLLMGYTPQPYLVNWTTNNGFTGAEERSWQVRYDYDFTGLGILGLTLMFRYTRGDHINRSGLPRGHEFERDTDIGYTVQSGLLKDLSLQLRTATVRSSHANKFDEVRFITSYPLKF